MVCCEEEDEARRALPGRVAGRGPAGHRDRERQRPSLGSLMDALAAPDVSVPDDMSVIAVAAARVAARTTPPVTAADVPSARWPTTAVQRCSAVSAPSHPAVRELFQHAFHRSRQCAARQSPRSRNRPRLAAKTHSGSCLLCRPCSPRYRVVTQQSNRFDGMGRTRCSPPHAVTLARLSGVDSPHSIHSREGST